MIKSENGLTHIKGTHADFMTDYACLTASLVKLLMRNGYAIDEIEEKIAELVSVALIHGFKDYEREKKDGRK